GNRETWIVDGLNRKILLLAQPQLAWQFEGVGQRQAHRHRREHHREYFEGDIHGRLLMPPTPRSAASSARRATGRSHDIGRQLEGAVKEPLAWGLLGASGRCPTERDGQAALAPGNPGGT